MVKRYYQAAMTCHLPKLYRIVKGGADLSMRINYRNEFLVLQEVLGNLGINGYGELYYFARFEKDAWG